MEKLIIRQILEILPEAKFIGDSNQEINGVDSLENYIEAANKLFWLSDSFFEQYRHNISAEMGLLISTEAAYSKLEQKPKNALLFDNPKLAFQKVLDTFFTKKIEPFTESSAVINHSVKIGNNCYVGHHVVIEDDVVIGDNCFIGHNSVLLHGIVIADNVKIGNNCTIGGDGFGYAKESDGRYVQLPHIGNVVIRENVTIHNNVCIDRAVIGATVLERNVKVDNHVHIAHGVTIGENSIVIAHAMIGGSTLIGRNCWIAPSVAIRNKLTIGEDSVVGLGAVVVKNVAEKSVMIGNPARSM